MSAAFAANPSKKSLEFPFVPGVYPNPELLIAEHYLPLLAGLRLSLPIRWMKRGGAGCAGPGLQGFDAVYSYAGSYVEGTLRKLIHIYKYNGVEPLAAPFGKLLAQVLPREQTFDVIVPMPLHWRKRWQRGFNQAELLAKEISRRWNVPVEKAVRRRRGSVAQAGLSNAQRRKNVAHVFKAAKGKPLDGKRVLLVDDVFTTGATASSCARVLKRAGAAHVTLLALARTDRRIATEAQRARRAPTEAGMSRSRRARFAPGLLGIKRFNSSNCCDWGSKPPMIALHQERLHRPVLVLNASYEPINVCAASRALVLVLKGVASAEEHSLGQFHSARQNVRVPSVIRLLEYRRIPHQTRALSRKNILMRDRYTCQYCGKTLNSGELTLDHVIPRSRSGETTWENLVACCHPCNNKKGNRTPEETGMRLARQPKPFSLHTSRHLMRLLGKSDDQWRKYLFY